MYLYNQRFDNDSFCKMNAGEKLCEKTTLIENHGLLQDDVVFKSYSCALKADEMGSFVLNSTHSPCYIEFYAPIFIEEFNLNAYSTPHNFVYVDTKQIPFQSNVEFASWQSLKFENAIAPGSQSLIHSREVNYRNTTLQFYTQTAKLRLRLLEKVSPLIRLLVIFKS